MLAGMDDVTVLMIAPMGLETDSVKSPKARAAERMAAGTLLTSILPSTTLAD
jgi:hypothetical protein